MAINKYNFQILAKQSDWPAYKCCNYIEAAKALQGTVIQGIKILEGFKLLVTKTEFIQRCKSVDAVEHLKMEKLYQRT